VKSKSQFYKESSYYTVGWCKKGDFSAFHSQANTSTFQEKNTQTKMRTIHPSTPLFFFSFFLLLLPHLTHTLEHGFFLSSFFSIFSLTLHTPLNLVFFFFFSLTSPAMALTGDN
jgi:hypothetical protein